MKKHILIILFALPFFAVGQYQTDSIISLKPPLTESSGLLFLNGTFITHGDSGNPPALYEIDTATGLPSRTIYVANATNIDWEDLAADDDYIYIGDFGNNQGTRQNLRIYKISQADYWANDTVTAQSINFSYADQTSFTPAPFQTNYDCEAMISLGDSLYVFTKQWGFVGTRAYAIPKTPGTYVRPVHDVIPINFGVVTGADFFEPFGTLALLINTPTTPYVHFRMQISGSDFSSSVTGPHTGLLVHESIQLEGIVMHSLDEYYFSSEAFNGQKAMLSSLLKNPIFSVEEHDISGFKLYPNPTTGFVNLVFETFQSGEVHVYDALGKARRNAAFEQQNEVRVQLPAAVGLYILEVIFKDGTRGVQRVLRL
jgi:hypothetical protein